MEIITTNNPDEVQIQALFNLWNDEYPSQLSFETIAEFKNYLSAQEQVNHYLLMQSENQIVGWAITFQRQSAPWFVLIIASSMHQQGYGTLLLNKLKATETTLNGWMVDHNEYTRPNEEKYLSPIGFYLKHGFTVCGHSRLELPHLSAVRINYSSALPEDFDCK